MTILPRLKKDVAKSRLNMRNPWHLLATGFGSGLSPIIPGTMGSLAAIPFWYLMTFLPWQLYSLVVMVVTVLLMQVSAEWLVRMVSGSSEALVLENGARYLRWTSPFYAVLGVLLSTRYALQSLGEKVLPLFSSVIEFLGKVVFVLVFIRSSFAG